MAVILSQHRPAGIDIEANEVAWQVVRRFYADKEKAVLQRLPAWQRDAIAKRLWQIKESYIKVYQYTLAQGLGIDYAYLIEDLIDSVIDDHHLMTVMDKKQGTVSPSFLGSILYWCFDKDIQPTSKALHILYLIASHLTTCYYLTHKKTTLINRIVFCLFNNSQ